MVDIILAVKNTLFRQSLKLFLEGEGITVVINQADHLDEFFIQENLPEIVITELSNAPNFISFENLVKGFPEIKFIVISPLLNLEEYSQLINTGVKGCIQDTSDLTELTLAIKEVTEGKIFFPHEVLQKIILYHPSGTDKDNNTLTDRELEILRLLCDGLSNEQISHKLCLSYDTVKWHRSNILIKCGCKNMLSLYKYAINKELV